MVRRAAMMKNSKIDNRVAPTKATDVFAKLCCEQGTAKSLSSSQHILFFKKRLPPIPDVVAEKSHISARKTR